MSDRHDDVLLLSCEVHERERRSFESRSPETRLLPWPHPMSTMRAHNCDLCMRYCRGALRSLPEMKRLSRKGSAVATKLLHARGIYRRRPPKRAGGVGRP